MLAAIKRGDHEAVRDAGESAKVSDANGKTAIRLAADLGHAKVVKVLLAAGATDSAQSTEAEWSAIARASFRGHLEALSELLAHPGICASSVDGCGITGVHAAAMKGHVDCTEMVLNAIPEAIDAKDVLGRTPLMLAAIAGSVDTIRLLADRGAELDLASNDGKTALHWAVLAHRPRAVESLVKLGCSTEKLDLPPLDPIPRPHGSHGLAKDPNSGKTPTEYAESRLGKDPVLVHMHKYLLSVEEIRKDKPGSGLDMEEMPWVSHAIKNLAEAQAVPVEEVPAATGSASGDLWDEDEVDAMSTGDEDHAAEAAAEAAALASMGDLEELD